MYIQRALQLHLSEEEHTQYRVDVQEQQEEAADVSQGGDRHVEGLEDHLHLAVLLSVLEYLGDTECPDEGSRGAEVYVHDDGDNGGHYGAEHDEEVEHVGHLAEVGHHTKCYQLEYRLKCKDNSEGVIDVVEYVIDVYRLRVPVDGEHDRVEDDAHEDEDVVGAALHQRAEELTQLTRWTVYHYLGGDTHALFLLVEPELLLVSE